MLLSSPVLPARLTAPEALLEAVGCHSGSLQSQAAGQPSLGLQPDWDIQAEVERSLVEQHILEEPVDIEGPADMLQEERLDIVEAVRIPAASRLAVAGFDRTFNNYRLVLPN